MNARLQEALAGFLEAPNDPVEGALVVARIIDVDADVDWARDEIGILAAEVGEDVAAAALAPQLGRLGFSGVGDRYYEAENNRLDHVLRTRQGIPISLGVVLLGVARQVGLAAAGVNFPRHFLVTIGDVLVDPYAMAPTTAADCRAWLKRNDMREEDAFDKADPVDIAMRMLNNVRNVAHERGDFVRSLDLSDYQLMIVPNSYILRAERADAWLGLEAPEMVVAELEQAVAHAPTKRIAERLRGRLERARRLRKSAVH